MYFRFNSNYFDFTYIFFSFFREVNLEEQVSKSTLNPLAAEFVPTFSPALAIPSTSGEFTISLFDQFDINI